ncbi:MAG: flavin reductase family protein [Thermomicrobiales bacterium]
MDGEIGAILSDQRFAGFAGHLVTGVAVVVTLADGEPFATTAGSVVAASWEPPLLAVFFRTGSRIAAALDRSGRFTVNILGEADHGLAHRFARSDRERGWAPFSDIELLHREPSPPVLAEAIAWADCSVTHAIPVGDHRCYASQILALDRRPDKAPLVYYRGRLRSLGTAVAPATWAAVDAGDLAAVW